MGYRSEQFTSSPLYAGDYNTFSVNPGICYSVTLFCYTPFIDPADAYGEIGFGTNQDDALTRGATLAAGYCGSDAPLFFVGRYPVMVDDNIVINLHSYSTAVWQIVFRIIPYSEKEAI